jgi:hypothetical protein
VDDPVAAVILRYFQRNPNCVDDLEGIARWRLLEERAAEVTAETAAALDRLVAAGLLVRIDSPGLRLRYRLPVAGGEETAARGRNRAVVAPAVRRPRRPRGR